MSSAERTWEWFSYLIKAVIVETPTCEKRYIVLTVGPSEVLLNWRENGDK